MKLKVLIKSLRHFLGGRYFLLFVNGFLLATLFYLYMEDSYEKQLFRAMASYIKEKIAESGQSKENVLQQSLHLTNYLGRTREVIFNKQEIHALKSTLIHPVTNDLMTISGACGSYSYILSRLLNEMGIVNRIAQMKVNGKYGGHIIVEAKAEKGWVVLDPLYDLYFKNPQGNMASFVEVQNNWEFYKQQIPKNYDTNYQYEGVRYANWEKVPVLMPMLKKVSYFILGKERTDGLSFRTLVLRKFHLLFQITIVIYIIMLLIAMRKYFKRKNAQAIGVFLLPRFAGKRVWVSDAKIKKTA